MSKLKTLSKLFNNRIFRIPDYQRGYAWGDEQLTDFWEDIINLPKEKNHYTGMISLKKLSKEDVEHWDENDKWILQDGVTEAFHVIDGQQRLTTSIILINCILEFCKKKRINLENIEDIVQTYLFSQNKSGILRTYKFGYEKNNPSYDYFKYKILEDDSVIKLEKSYYTANLNNAKQYFDKQLEEFIRDNPNKIEEILNKVTNFLQFNVYEIEEGFDVNVAFETMNNRGKKLSNLEILKNRLIYLLTMYDDHVLSMPEKDSIRNKINEAWKEIYRQLGRDESNKLDDDEFLKNHWIMYFKYSRQRGDDYIKYLLQDFFTVRAIHGKTRHIEIHESNLEDEMESYDIFEDDNVLHYVEIIHYVDSLSKLSRYWLLSKKPELALEEGYTDQEVKWLIKLNRIGMGYFRPIIVATLCDSSLEPKDRIELYQIIERCIFTWFRMAGFNNTLYSVESYNISRILFQTFNLENTNKSSAKYKKSIFTNKEISLMFGASEDEIDNSFEMNENKSSVLVSLYVKFLESKFQLHYKSVKDSFIARVKNYLERDGYFDWKPLRYFLYEYEDYLYVSSKRLDQIPATWRPATKGYYSIEHIYPQKPQDWYWKNQFRDYNTSEKEMCIKTLGNMLLLASDINASLQNHSYKRKCKPLNKERTGYINGSFSEREVAKKYNDWNPSNIYERTIKLLDFFGTRWNIKFDRKEKIVLSGMDFMETKREVSEELFNTINLFEEMSNKFEEAGYIVNIENRYIQFMQKEWIFDDKIDTSIHFELKINKGSFENLLGKKNPIQLVFHTESACPVKLKNQLKQLRRKIGKQEIANDFTTREKCIESVQSINSHVVNILEEYSHEVSEIVKKYKHENLN